MSINDTQFVSNWYHTLTPRHINEALKPEDQKNLTIGSGGGSW